MLIGQASDLHLHADPNHINLQRFVRVIDHLLTIEPLPDLLILSGDLTDAGETRAYEHLRNALRRWPRPVHLMMGNHDDRDQLASIFPELPYQDGLVQYAIETPGVRIILLDTTEQDLQGGSFCDRRSKWLVDQLRSNSRKSALIFMHHPPVQTGLPWVDPGPAQRWVERFRSAVEGRKIAGIFAGHVHASTVTHWNGVPVVTCPSTSSDLSLIFSAMDSSRPDGRPLVERSEPGFALHRCLNSNVTSFFGRCPQRVLERWDRDNSPAISRMLREQEF